MSEPLLEVTNLNVTYGRGRKRHHVLHDVSFSVGAGETLSLVGESGSGKSTVGRAILGLAPVQSGSIRLQGEEISSAPARRRRQLASDLQVIFQDPYSSLNPRMLIGDILAEPLLARGVSRAEASDRIGVLLNRVRLPEDAANRYAREFSGGQRQRVAIARALAIKPTLIICDEPVSALDLSTQLTVLDLFTEIQEATGVAYLFVSHDLAVVRGISHRVMVMNQGEIVESGAAEQVTENPAHPYTQKLLLAAPVPDPERQAERRRLRLQTATR